MSQHTPGPWIVDALGYGYDISAPEARCLITTSSDPKMVWGAIGREADARLIAAAPELLEAIEAAIASGMVPGESITGGPGAKTQQGKAAAMLRAAIAKAKGEE